MKVDSRVCFVLVRSLVVGLILALPAAPDLVASATAEDAIVMTENGPVQGVVTPTVHKFLGIPYAAPPVGSLRWQPPQPHANWATPIDASTFGNHCPQPGSSFGVSSSTEDCLYLNVYIPNRKGFARDVRQRRPVMLWIHGGALLTGESDDYDPTRLVEMGDVIVVTINYRLGALGFLAHPALTAESPDHASGNYGLMDQQFALQWVQHNIRGFGGTPRRVTIFGESAGGLSVHAQLASPLAHGLFHRAIVQSGAYQLTQPTLATGEAQGTALATALGCNDQSAECLRAVPVDQIIANQGTGETSTSLFVDGKVLTQTMRAAFGSGQFNRVPVMEGTTHDEFRLFVGANELANGPLTADHYPDAIAALGVPPESVQIVVDQYPLANYPSPSIALGALVTDVAFSCSARVADRLLSKFVPTFAYEFNDENAPELFLPPVSFPYGAAHASEIQYVFDVRSPFPTALNADQQQLSDTMVRYWTRFARSGKPRASKAAFWPRYMFDANNPSAEELLSLVPPMPESESGAHKFVPDHHCVFWAVAGIDQ